MHTISLPGFTASNSLCSSSRNYTRPSTVPIGSSWAIEPQLRAGGGGPRDDCVATYQNCYIDCSVRYPESGDSVNNLNSQMRQGCFDSCDAAYRLCSPARGAGTVGWGVGRIAHTTSPTAG